MKFWDKINKGYNLIKKGDYTTALQQINEFEIDKLSEDEYLALFSLKAWVSIFSKKNTDSQEITKRLIETKEGIMPAWYRALGFFLKGLLGISSLSDERFEFFKQAANNYEIHINQEIPKFSSPPDNLLNTAVSTYFHAISILEANEKLENLIDFKNKFALLKNSKNEKTIDEIIRAAKFQINVNQNLLHISTIKEIGEIEGYEIDPVYYCNLILRFND